MADYKRAGKVAIDGLRNAFRVPQVPLVTGVPVRNTVRYNRSPQDAALYFGQLVAVHRISHRTLVGVTEIQDYLLEVLGMPWPRWRAGTAWEVRLNVVPATDVAHYRSGVITVPDRVSEIVVLHELGHHFAPVPQGHHGVSDPQFHGPAFVAAFLDLVEHVMNPEAARVLAECLAVEGISV